MFDSRAFHTRTCGRALRLAIGCLAVGLTAVVVVAVEALAHHPGSHARRLDNGTIRVDAVAVLSDACTRVASIRAETPPDEPAPATGSIPVTLRLSRPADAVCATVVGTGEATIEIDARPAAARIHLYTLGADGRLLATERVPIR